VFNNLKVNGKLTLLNELEITDLIVEGDTKLNTLEVTGNTNLNTLEVTGDTNLHTLEVTGDTNLLDLNVTGQSVLTELEVTGDTSLNNVQVSGTTSLQALNSLGPVNFTGGIFNTEYLTVYKELSVVGDILANSESITPEELGYLSNLVSNIQDQLDSKVETNNPVFTGTVTLPSTRSNGYTYFGNDGSSQPTYGLSNYFGAIGANMTNGQAEMDFINSGYNHANLTDAAFDFYILTSTTTKTLLMRLYNSGGLLISGLLNAIGGITTTTLTATGLSTLANVNLNGNLTVTGSISSSTPGNMEILYFQLKGNAGNVVETMTLEHNATATTNYSVFPSLYYNYSGSSGTYDALSTSSSLNNIVIGARTASSFNWSVNKTTGDNVNVFIVFLVIYNASSSNYPSYYTS
jgi:hypothetical protein